VSQRCYEREKKYLSQPPRPVFDVATVGDCVECGQYVYEDDEYEDLGDDQMTDEPITVIHAECLNQQGKQE
jgi:hypothetical protein